MSGLNEAINRAYHAWPVVTPEQARIQTLLIIIWFSYGLVLGWIIWG